MSRSTASWLEWKETDVQTDTTDCITLPASAVGNTIRYETICQFNMTEASIIYRTRTNKIRKQNKRKKQRRTKRKCFAEEPSRTSSHHITRGRFGHGGRRWHRSIQGGPKKWGHRLTAIILSNLNRFTKTHWKILSQICR